MLSYQYQSIPSVSSSEKAKQSAKNFQFRSLVAVIAALAVVSLVGSAVYRSESETASNEELTQDAVNRAVIFKDTHSCETYASATIASGNEILSSVPIADEMVVAFTFQLETDSPTGNIFQLGDDDDNEWPAVFFRNQNQDFLRVKFKKKGTKCEQKKHIYDILFNREYRLEVAFQGMHVTIKLDGTLEHEFTLDSSCKPDASTFPAYACTPWNSVAQGKVSNVQICSSVPPTSSPTTAPPTNGSPTTAPTVNQCQSHGAVGIASDQKLFDAEITDKMSIELTLEMTKEKQDGTILQIGDIEDNEWPRLAWRYRKDRVKVFFEKQGGKVCEHVLDNIDAEKQYDVEIVIDNLQCQIFVNGKLKLDFAIDKDCKPDASSVPVYASTPWHTAAKGEVSNIKVCTIA